MDLLGVYDLLWGLYHVISTLKKTANAKLTNLKPLVI